MSHWVEVNSIRYSWQQLQDGVTADPNDRFATSVFSFCRDWLSGVNEFPIHTSGSTGQRKTIVITRASMMASASATALAVGLRKDDIALLCLDAAYIAGRMMLVRSFVTGMNIIAHAPKANPLEDVTMDVDFAAFVPYQLHAMMTNPLTREKLNRMKAILLGGASVSTTLANEIRSLAAQVYATYGMTETVSHIALQKLNGPDADAYFHALPGIELKIDERGCLVINAPYLENNPVVTNDLVEIVEPDKFKWLGRYDNIINTGGVKVVPESIEKKIGVAFEEFGIRNRFFIAGVNDEQLGKKVTLVIEGEEDNTLPVLNLLRSSLSPYEMPRNIRWISEFTETATQKIDRRAALQALGYFQL